MCMWQSLSLSLLTLLAALIGLFFLTIHSSAQQSRYDAFEINFDSTDPSPGEEVEITIRSGYFSSFNIRSVRWFVNGEEKTEFANKLNITEVNENFPKQIIANIVHFNHSGGREYAQVIGWMRPVIFDLFWEADSVTTPMYKGQKLAGPQTPIQISAKIQYIDEKGDIYTEKDFSFRWMIETEFHNDQGPGVSSVVYEEGGTYLNNFISVRSEAFLINDPNIGFEKRLIVPVVQPRLLIYPYTLLHGLRLDRTLPERISFSEKKFTASVYPFYFSGDDFEKSGLQYDWFVNNSQSPSKSGRRIDISVEGADASVPIRITAKNENRNLQKSSQTLLIDL